MIARTRLLPRDAYHRDARLFVIAVEGRREEPWYFDGLRTSGMIPVQRVRLEILVPEEDRSAPEHVAARLQAFEASHKLIPADGRWLVLDVDRHHNLKDTLAAADAAGWSFSVSNPCFEVWLQLHFVDVADGVDSHAAKASWRTLRQDRQEVWPFDVVAVERACVRAERGFAGAEWVPASPGTTVSRLVRELVTAAATRSRG